MTTIIGWEVMRSDPGSTKPRRVSGVYTVKSAAEEFVRLANDPRVYVRAIERNLRTNLVISPQLNGRG